MGGAFFENVFSAKGAQKNSQKWGAWGGLRGLGLYIHMHIYIYIYINPIIYIYIFPISQLATSKLADLRVVWSCSEEIWLQDAALSFNLLCMPRLF